MCSSVAFYPGSPHSATVTHTQTHMSSGEEEEEETICKAFFFSGIQAFKLEFSHFMSEVEYLESVLTRSAQCRSLLSPEVS